ncbi:MAG TPA: transglycosylase domain-containing protein [Thermoanaerobaculia bacterium]
MVRRLIGRLLKWLLVVLSGALVLAGFAIGFLLLCTPFLEVSAMIHASRHAKYSHALECAVIAAEAPSSSSADMFTQQLVKEWLVRHDLRSRRALSGTIQRVLLARAVDLFFSRDEILKAYLDQVFLGRNLYGVHNAAVFYFRKRDDQLNVAENALLAGLIRSPIQYSPFGSVDRATARRNLVLARMLQRRSIDRQTYDWAIAQPLTSE